MGIFDQVKQAMQMRNEAKRIQAEIEKITVPYENGGIKAVVNGDMSLSSIAISDDTYAEIVKGDKKRFETMLFNVINGALKGAKKATQEQMAKMMQAGGAGSLFGK